MKELGKNALEWTVFALSCLMIAGVIGFLAWTTWKGGAAPAHLEASVGAPRAVGSSWQVEVNVENRGDQGVQNVEVEVEWPATKQTARFVVIEIPPRGQRRGTAVFRASNGTLLRAQALKARVLGWTK